MARRPPLTLSVGDALSILGEKNERIKSVDVGKLIDPSFVRSAALQAYPQIKHVLNALAPRLTSPIITALNYLVDGQRMSPQLVARIFLQQQGLLT